MVGRGRGRVLVAAFLVAAVLGACSSTAPLDPSASPPGSTTAGTENTAADACRAAQPDPAVVLTVWHTYSNVYLDIFHELTQRFMAAHPGVTVQDTQFDGAEQLEAALRDVKADAEPDVVVAPELSVRRFVDAGRFIEGEACLRAAAVELHPLLPVVRRAWSLDGRLWAIPTNVSAPLLFYNPRLFGAAGIEAPPHDRATLEAACRKLVAAGARSGLVVDRNMAVWITEQWAAQRGRPLVPSGDAGARASVVDDLTWLAAMEREHLVEDVGTNGTGYDDMLLVRTPDRPAGMAIHSSAALGVARSLADAGAVQKDDLLAAPLPGPGGGAMVGGSAAWITARDGRARSSAAVLVGFLAAPAQQATMSARGGYLPASADALTEPELVDAWARYPQLRVAYDQAVATPDDGVFSLSTVGPRREIRSAMLAAVDAVEGGEPAEASLDRAMREVDAVVQAYDASVPPPDGRSR